MFQWRWEEADPDRQGYPENYLFPYMDKATRTPTYVYNRRTRAQRALPPLLVEG
jgi:hypothetical protein